MMIIFVLMIIVIIGIIILVSLLLANVNKSKVYDDVEEILYEDVEQITNRTTFFRIHNCINQYINAIKLQDQKAYMAMNKDTKVEKEYSASTYFYSKEMHSIDKVTNITAFVKGYLRDNVIEEEKYYIVNLDYNNNTFYIEDSTKEEYMEATSNRLKQIHKNEITVQNNQYNMIPAQKITDFSILKLYFDDYKFKAINRPEEAFALLEMEYRKMKFNNDVNQFVNYVKSNLESIQDANIVKHGITKEGSVTKYTFVDQYDHYYELRETGIYEYTMVLDNYTVASDEQKQEYERLPEEQKAVSNMDKVMKLINEKDYSTVYGYLNIEFKNTNFPTIETFTTYMQANFFENNIVGKIGTRKEGNIYLLKVPYKESLSSVAEEGEKTFMMKLGEGTNFEISFEI